MTDRDGDGIAETPGGFVVDQPCRDGDDDTGDPAIAALPLCPAGFDSRWHGTVNSPEVIDRITGQSSSDTRRDLLSVDGLVRGEIVKLPGGPLGFAVGGQFRRETLNIDYDSIYNDNGYVFLFGGPDLEDEARHVIAGLLSGRLRGRRRAELRQLRAGVTATARERTAQLVVPGPHADVRDPLHRQLRRLEREHLRRARPRARDPESDHVRRLVWLCVLDRHPAPAAARRRHQRPTPIRRSSRGPASPTRSACTIPAVGSSMRASGAASDALPETRILA